MILNGFTLTPLAEDLHAANPELLPLFYANDAAFGGSAHKIVRLMRLILEKGLRWGYFSYLKKSLFLSTPPTHEASSPVALMTEVITLSYATGSHYLRDYFGTEKVVEDQVQPMVKLWSRGVRFMAKFAAQSPQMSYTGLGILLQLEWQYLKRNIPKVIDLMETIQKDITKDFFPILFARGGVRSMVYYIKYCDTASNAVV